MIKHKTFFIFLFIFLFASNNMIAFAEENYNIPIVISLGDSYSSGEGIEPFYGQDNNRTNNPDWLAHRSQKSWPSLLKINGLEGQLSNYKDTNWYFVAASGAVTGNLYNTQNKQYNKDGYQGTYDLLPQLDIFDKVDKDRIAYVTLTFGGNDVSFSKIIGLAVFDTVLSVPYIAPKKLTDNLNQIWESFYADNGIKEDIRRAYISIGEKAGENAKIIVVGYPTLLNKNGKGALFTKKQAEIINENVSKFNNELSSLVNECNEAGLNIYFVSVEEAFRNHEAYTKKPYINSVILLAQDQDITNKMPSAYSIHPNEEGAKIYADCVQTKIDKLSQDSNDAIANNVNMKIEDILKNKILEQILQKIRELIEELHVMVNEKVN